MMFCHRAAVATEVPPNLRTVQVFMLRGEQRSNKRTLKCLKVLMDVLFLGLPIVGGEWMMMD